MGDPSDILPPSEIEAMAQSDRDTHPLAMSIACHDRRKLLRHLHALTAPADGQALGRIGWDVYRKEHAYLGQGWIAWEDMDDDSRAAFVAPAIHLHAIGHAAGALSREGEVAAMREEIARLAARRDKAEAAQDAEHALAEAGRAEIARLTAELAEVRKEATAVRDDVVHSMTREADARVAAARADGAREERRLTIDDMLTVARETHPLAQPAVHDAMSALGKRIKARPAGAVDPSARGDR